MIYPKTEVDWIVRHATAAHNKDSATLPYTFLPHVLPSAISSLHISPPQIFHSSNIFPDIYVKSNFAARTLWPTVSTGNVKSDREFGLKRKIKSILSLKSLNKSKKLFFFENAILQNVDAITTKFLGKWEISQNTKM